MSTKEHCDNVKELIHRLNNKNDAHEALGLHQNASEKEINDRYKYLRKLVHPDKNGGCEHATKAFQRLYNFYTKLLKPGEDINQNTYTNEADEEDDSSDEEDDSSDDEFEAREFERYQQWKREFEKEYTEDVFRRRNGEFRRADLNFIKVFLSILIVFLAIGFVTIHNRKATKPNLPYLPRTLHPPEQLLNQTIFMRECYNVKSCVILFLPEKGMCSEKKSEEKRQYFETSFETFALKHKIRKNELGRLWTHYQDQQELENGIQILNETMTPLLIFANFGKEKYWSKKLENNENEETIRRWIFRCSKGKEKKSFDFDVSKWSIYSSITGKYIPKIKAQVVNFQWNNLLSQVVIKLLPGLCYFNSL